MKRQHQAEESFLEADKDGSGTIDESELAQLLSRLLTSQNVRFDEAKLARFCKSEFAAADTDRNGLLDFDEFVAYYNSFIDLHASYSEFVERDAAQRKQLAALCRKIQLDGPHGLCTSFLDASHSDLTDAEVALLMDALVARGAPVAKLYLQGNAFGDAGAKSIASALPRLPKLRALQVHENAALTKAGRSQIMAAARGTQLADLSLGGEAEDGDDQLIEVFKSWDINGDGALSLDEVHSAVGSMGIYPSRSVIARIFDDADRNCDGQIGYQEFVQLVQRA